MSNHAAAASARPRAVTSGAGRPRLSQIIKRSLHGFWHFAGGLAILVVLWWAGIFLITRNPSTAQFADFGPVPTFRIIPHLWATGKIQHAVIASGHRLGIGLLIAIAIGVPIGIFMGRSPRFRNISNSPFQFLRMVSPLSWVPLAVLVFTSWDQAIIFLIAIASVWPVMFSTAAGLSKVDPAWFKVARNLGAKPRHMLTRIIIPAITFDVLTGIRLALGVAWIVLVPAEFLGVTSGLGYAIENAREGMEYGHLMAYVLVIGAVGYVLDGACLGLIRRFSWRHGD
ncbi:MAG: ABC transporter permease [Acidiferrobacteraceae bacterium]